MSVTNNKKYKKTVKNKKAQVTSTSNTTAEQNKTSSKSIKPTEGSNIVLETDYLTVPNPPFSAAANHVLNQLQGSLKTEQKPHLITYRLVNACSV